MRPLVLLVLLVATASAVPSRLMEYSFMVPKEGEPDQVERSQFEFRDADGSLSWGYAAPGRVHLEGRDSQGLVTGSYGYVDANGVLVVNNYEAHPEHGFELRADVLPGISPDSKLAKYRDIVVERLSPETVEEPVPAQYKAPLEAKPEAPQIKAAPKPSVYLAQDNEGKPVRVAELLGESQQFKNQAQFRVAQDVVESAKSVSELAVKLNALPVAAVHDVQLSPHQRVAYENYRPVLVHYENVPVPQTYDLLFPVSEQN